MCVPLTLRACSRKGGANRLRCAIDLTVLWIYVWSLVGAVRATVPPTMLMVLPAAMVPVFILGYSGLPHCKALCERSAERKTGVKQAAHHPER